MEHRDALWRVCPKSSKWKMCNANIASHFILGFCDMFHLVLKPKKWNKICIINILSRQCVHILLLLKANPRYWFPNHPTHHHKWKIKLWWIVFWTCLIGRRTYPKASTTMFSSIINYQITPIGMIHVLVKLFMGLI